jgi:4-amino-4-deoxy-L-arabinose transferase-like glycosyltransferase
VAGALILAAAGQALLEQARARGTRPNAIPVAAAFVAAGALAVAAFRKSSALPQPPVPLEPPRHSPRLYLACLPGAVCLVVASCLHLRSPGRDAGTARLWILGLVLLLLPGLWDSRRHVSFRKPSRETLRWAAAAGLLFALAFALRVAGGIDRIPGWIDADEWATGIDGRAALAEGTGGIFEFWGMGNPRMTLLVSQLAAWPFGDGLRALRLGSALLGSLTIVLLFDFGRRLAGAPAAFVAALLAAANHVLLHWSRVGQIYVHTPFFTALSLALLLRAVTGGSFLALTAAGIAMALGAVTYIPTLILPALVLLTLAGWAIVLDWPRRRAFTIAAFLAAIVLLVVAPIAITIAKISPEIALERIPAIALLRPEGPAILAGSYRAESVRSAIVEHGLRTVGLFNFGTDWFHAYGAHRSLLDPLTAALAPIAFALVLARLSSALGWVVTLFVAAYLAGGVFLLSTPPTYHRIAVVVLFACLAVGWALAGLARGLKENGVRGWTPAVLAGVVVAGSAWLNLDQYFRKEPRIRRLDAAMGVGKLICRYASTHTVIDATGFSDDRYARLDCPEARPTHLEVSRLEAFLESERPPRAVVILPATVETGEATRSGSYRLIRKSLDRSIGYPEEVALSILELDRVAR